LSSTSQIHQKQTKNKPESHPQTLKYENVNPNKCYGYSTESIIDLTLPLELNPHQVSSISSHERGTQVQNLPMRRFDHPLDNLISHEHTRHIQYIVNQSYTTPESPIQSMDNKNTSLVNHQSFLDLLSYVSPINDSIFYQYLLTLHITFNGVDFLDTNFHQELTQHGWDKAANKFF
jgi:hypothetical protein